MRFFTTLVIVFFATVFISGGCRKIKQTRLKGTWQVVDVSGLNSWINEEWTFQSGGALAVSQTISYGDSSNITTTNTAKYKMKSSKAIMLEGFTSPTMTIYNTKWQIVEISSEHMLLVNDQQQTSGLMFIDFKRIK